MICDAHVYFAGFVKLKRTTWESSYIEIDITTKVKFDVHSINRKVFSQTPTFLVLSFIVFTLPLSCVIGPVSRNLKERSNRLRLPTNLSIVYFFAFKTPTYLFGLTFSSAFIMILYITFVNVSS